MGSATTVEERGGQNDANPDAAWLGFAKVGSSGHSYGPLTLKIEVRAVGHAGVVALGQLGRAPAQLSGRPTGAPAST